MCCFRKIQTNHAHVHTRHDNACVFFVTGFNLLRLQFNVYKEFILHMQTHLYYDTSIPVFCLSNFIIITFLGKQIFTFFYNEKICRVSRFVCLWLTIAPHPTSENMYSDIYGARRELAIIKMKRFFSKIYATRMH